MAALLVSHAVPQAQAACAGNAIVCENQQPGTPASEWDIDGAGDATIQGFATDISVNAGSQHRVQDRHRRARATRSTIYRLGYYQGDGARQIATIAPVGDPAAEPAGLR